MQQTYLKPDPDLFFSRKNKKIKLLITGYSMNVCTYVYIMFVQ